MNSRTPSRSLRCIATHLFVTLLLHGQTIYAQSTLQDEGEALIVRHIPNPVDGHYSKESGYNTWDYKTEIINIRDVPLQLTHFGIYVYEGGTWILRNLGDHLYTKAEFTRWYSAEDSIVEGWIPAGKVAISSKNSNTWRSSVMPPTKWVYHAVDPAGNEYSAEEEIHLNPAPVAILNGSIVYPRFYKFRSGDDTSWAASDLDDGDWAQVLNGTFPLDKWTGVGWFRFVLKVDSSLWSTPLGLHLGNIFGGAEFYLDGKLIHRVGTIALSSKEEEAQIMWDPAAVAFSPRSPEASGRSRHIVAIRYSSFFWDSPTWSGRKSYLEWEIDDLGKLQANRSQQTRKATFHQMFLMGIFLAFALVHLLLFFFYPRMRSNLYFAGVTSSAAMLVFFQFQEMFISNATHFAWNWGLLMMAGNIFILSLLRFTYSLIYGKLPKIFYVFILSALIISVWVWLRPFVIGKYQFIFYIAGLTEIGRAVAVSWIKKRKLLLEGSWIILIGSIPSLFVGSYYFLATDALALVPLPWEFNDFPAPYYAMLTLMISVSVFLGRNFAQTNKNLEAKLVEVQELSKQALQHERERSRLEAENARKTQELEEARQLQLSMLPKQVPRIPNLEIAVYSKPATEVGGDYYDFHLDSNGTLTIAIGDATGHGMKAGTMVSITKGLFQSLAHEESIPLVLKRISAAIDSMHLGPLFMALTLVRLKDRTFWISAAGMPPAIHYKATTRSFEEVVVKGLPLGGFPDFPYEVQEGEILPGDTLVLMSDGLPERFNEKDEILDYPVAVKLVEEVAHEKPQTIIEHLVNAGNEWANGRPQDDDVTFVVLKMTG